MAGFGDIKSWDFNYLHMFLYELIASTTLLYQLTCIYSPISMGEPGIFQFCGSPLLKCMANTQVVSKVVACYGYVLLKRNIHKIICNLEYKWNMIHEYKLKNAKTNTTQHMTNPNLKPPHDST